MHRVDTSNAVGALPSVQPASTPGYFYRGDPGTSTPATTPGQDWFNMIQEELIAVVLAAGLTPDQTKVDFGQLKKALDKGWGMLSTTNQQRLPGGYLLQWGSYNLTGTPLAPGAVIHVPVTFPSAFTTSYLQFVSGYYDFVTVGSTQNSLSSMDLNFSNTHSVNLNIGANWLVIGK